MTNKRTIMGLWVAFSATLFSAMSALADTATHSSDPARYVNGGTIVVTTTYTNLDAPGTLNNALFLQATLPAGWTISGWSATAGAPLFNGTSKSWVFLAPGATPITVTYTVNTVGTGDQSITDEWGHKRADSPTFVSTFAQPNPLTTTTAAPPEFIALQWSGGNVGFTWSSTTARTYSVQATTSLYPTVAWSNVPGMQSLPGSNGTMSAIHSNVPGAQGFYRVRAGL